MRHEGLCDTEVNVCSKKGYVVQASYIYSLLLPLCRLGRGVCGRVKFANLADGFVEKPLELLSIGDVVKAKVLE